MGSKPILMVSSYPPRLCGIATFCEEAREFIQKRHPDRKVAITCDLCSERERGPLCLAACPLAGKALRYEPDSRLKGRVDG